MTITRVLHQRISSVMEILANSAVTQICMLVEECCDALRLEVSQSKMQVKVLEEKLRLAELKCQTTNGKEQTPSSTCDSPVSNVDAVDMEDEDGRVDEVDGITGNQHTHSKELSKSPSGHLTMTATSSDCSSDTPRKQHITSFRVGETPKIQACTTCCSLYHCPFCQPSAFKPNGFHRIIPHIQSHLRSAVQNDEYIVYNCKLTCRDKPHYHCTYCGHVVCKKQGFIKHFEDCRMNKDNARVEAPLHATTVLTQQQPSSSQRALAPKTSTVVVSTCSSDVPQTSPVSTPRPVTPSSPSVAPESPNTDGDKPDTSADHNLVPCTSGLVLEPPSPDVYPCPPTPHMEKERLQRPAQREAVQIQCNHCGIFLNKRNFRVHMKRRHRNKFIAEESEEALRRYLANSKLDTPPWRRPTRVDCDPGGIKVNKKNFKMHVRRKHKADVMPLAFQESFERCLSEQGLLVVESSLLCSDHTEAPAIERREGWDRDLFMDIDVGEEQCIRFSNTSTQLSLETNLTTQQVEGEAVQIGMNPKRYHGLGKPHLLELPLESLVWIFRDVLRADGKAGYWNLALVCRTFRTILRNEIIRKYSTGKKRHHESHP
ncbi:hypothetical protein UPYG_G00046940 [Umbra pygmaea]|uniref:Uncharacterized protein n=1 Tax=Umbra pygmaea TaxID=75934 RepID=A0ABD0YD06_UMBPY